jgi:hypothetical protein
MTEPFSAPQRYADRLLHEWAIWQREDVIRCGWPRSTAFGKAIKPDPRPPREPIDDARAALTDAVIARLIPRQRRIVKIMYMDPRPITVKERVLRVTSHGYDKTRRALLDVVYFRLKVPER